MGPESFFTQMIELSVPSLPPSVNHYWKTTRFGGRYVSAEGVAYKKLLMREANTHHTPLGTRANKYSLLIEFLSPTWMTKKNTFRKIDLDNLAKCAIDAFCLAIEIDDSQIFELIMSKKDADADCTFYRLV